MNHKNAISRPNLTVYVHGIGPFPTASAWKSQWDLGLFGKPMNEKTIGAYWSDVLYGAGSRPEPGNTAFDESDIDTLLREIGIEAKDGTAADFVARLSARLNRAAEDAFDSVTASSGKERPTGSGKIKDVFFREFLRDSVAYFFDTQIRNRIKNRVRRTLSQTECPFVLVAHNMGSVVAYEVLSELKPEQRARVALFVTLGSPLGIREIQEQLRRREIALVVPPDIAAWHNFVDRFDPVVFDARLGNDFPASSGAHEIQDHRIASRSLWNTSRTDPHDSAGYLSHPEVRSVVHQALRFDSTGRFVVARDVAQGFAARGKRQPVLIEVLEPQYPAVDEEESDMKKRESEQRRSNQRLKGLPGRIKHLADEVEDVVRSQSDKRSADAAVEAARVQCLRKYVAAHLTPDEIQSLADAHASLNIYAMWRSSAKKKLITRSHSVLGADAARSSFKAMGSGITWAVLDTGCRFDHPHFQYNVKTQAGERKEKSLIVDVLDCTTTSNKPVSLMDESSSYQSDVDGHGTHVCGIISGRGTGKYGKWSGVAPKTRLLVYKVLDDRGNGEDAWIIKAIDDIFRRNEDGYGISVHGVNLSLGGPFDPTVYGCGASPICQMLRDIWRQGTLVCAAAGNDGQIQVSTQDGYFDLNTSLSIGDPANLQECIAVGSVHTDKPYLYGISYFSSRGPTADGRVKPDVVAPGERISSCSNDWQSERYCTFSGTSMACPHISGLLAAFLSVRREFIGRPDEVKNILLNNCNDVGRDAHHQGRGIPNLLKMLTAT